MSEIRKSGKIPTSTSVYEEDYKISDSFSGKYISLKGYKEFYNPGIGLELSAPTDVQVGGVSEKYESKVTTYTNSQSYSNLNKRFITTPIGVAITNQISGIPSTARALAQTDSKPLPFFKAPKDGEYTFTFLAKGSFNISASSNPTTIIGDFLCYFGYAGHQETILTKRGLLPTSSEVVRTSSGAFDSGIVVYKKSLLLNDVVEIWGELFAYGTTTSTEYTLDFTDFSVNIDYAQPAASATGSFKNSLNILDFNNKKIRLYGAERDTLILKGNKLTS